jgi:DNA polymerase (family 10)
MGKFDIARALREIGELLKMRGESQFKTRAYDNASRALEALDEERLALLVESGRLTELPGVGESIAGRITDLHRTGTTKLLEELRGALPPGFLELSRVPNLGPKKVDVLTRQLGITSLEALEAACREGRVRGLKGFGEKTEQKILEGIAQLRDKKHERVLLVDALAIGEPLLAHVRAAPGVARAELAGSLRRWKETVADLDCVVGLAEGATVEGVMDHFCAYPLVEAVMSRGDTKCTVRLAPAAGAMQVDLRVVPDADFATALHHFTGSKEHHLRLRGIARGLGLTISEWGVFRIDENGAATEEKIPIASEAALYERLGLQYVPPELREDVGEIELAERHAIPEDLVDEGDLRGVVHCHTVFSDGRNTVEEMARAADALGLEYLTVTDHSPTAGYAGGVGLDRLKTQWDEIARVQELVKVRLLRGTESDILEDGLLDYPDSVLEQLDVVIASVHNRYGLDADRMTARLKRTMELPLYKIWGHPLGRLINRREPFACRVEEILDVLARGRGAVEVNGDPNRLDFEPRWLRAASERGIEFVISADAHSVAALGNLRFGVHLARRAGLRRVQILNTRDVDSFRAAVRPTG